MIRVRLAELRARAEACLANEQPTAAEAHELAARVLEALAAIEDASERHPFREPAPRDEAHETAAVVALERALEASEARLRAALEEIAALRRGRT